jgi:DNA polymerase-3 subunit epsilon
MKKQIFIDTETTGLNPKKDKITQLAYLYFENGKKKDSGNLKGGGIYKSFLKSLDKFVDKFQKGDKMYFVGHNSHFDSDFIREMFAKNGNNFYGSYFYNPVVCTIMIASYKAMLKNKRPEDFTLLGLCKFFKIKVDENKLHDALYDITKTRELYLKLTKW